MWAIVPLKTFTQAKQRLAAVLSEEERRALMLAMARDVLGALCQCEGLSGVLIASRTQEADALAAAFNTERFSESPQADLPATLAQASEIWITSSTREIVPVTQLNSRAVGDGCPGPVWKTLSDHYRAYKAAIREGWAE